MIVTDSPYILGTSLIGQTCNIPSQDIHPKIELPLTTSPMRQLLRALSAVMKHNFIQSILILAGGVMALHYQQVIKVNSGCPAIIAAGPSETGKSTYIKCALSLTGMFKHLMHATKSNSLAKAFQHTNNVLMAHL